MIVSAEEMGVKGILPKIDIKQAKADIIEHNPDVHEGWYRTIDLQFLPFCDIHEKKYTISRRLYEIMMESHLSKYLPESQT